MKSGLKSIFGLQLLAAAVALAACSGLPQSSTSTGGTGTGTGFTIGGTVTGLSGTGLVLQDNGGDNLTITKSGPFVFPTSVMSAYAVTVLSQPTNPAQSCGITGASGTATANVTSVTVTCTTAAANATIGVTVSGLTGSGLTGAGVVLQDNGGDSLTVSANGSYTFKTPVTGSYSVSVLTQPTNPTQICTVANGSGIATANVTGIAVTCVNSFTIGGNVNGLVGTGLILQDNNAEKLPITANGAFVFKTQLPTGTAYTVTVFANPTGPAQTCTLVSGTGTGTASGNVNTVVINCPAVTYSVGGNIVGLVGKAPSPPTSINLQLTDNSFQIQNNNGDNYNVQKNGPFSFATPVAMNGAYNVSVFTAPSTQVGVSPQPTIACWTWGFSGVVTGNVTSVTVDCGHDDWTWINGTKTAGPIGAPAYGSFPTTPPTTVPNPFSNTPGARIGGATWTDASGTLWLFGGQGWELSGKTPAPDTLYGDLNDLWQCQIPRSVNYCQWNLLETPVGTQFPIAQNEDLPGNYGAKGTGSTSNLPGARWGSATWTDSVGGNLWLFGGEGIDSADNEGLLNDLWEYNISAKTWTWVGGANTMNAPGVYSGTEVPGARWAPVSWTDQSGNFWLFGGQGYDANGNVGFLNDLWKFNGTTWTFVNGSTTYNGVGAYGTQGTGSTTNTPGGRQNAVSWVDASGNLWLFGGEGEDSVAPQPGDPTKILNDLWEYTISNNQWTWISGSSTANQNGSYGTNPFIGPTSITTAAGEGTGSGVPLAANGFTGGLFPGSRWGAAGWTDKNGNLWLFGGWGQDSVGTDGNGALNDLWVYTPSATQGQAGTWVWVKGSNTGNQNGVYGSLNRPYAHFYQHVPGGRNAAMHWVDAYGELWLFGGQGYDSTSTTGNGFLNDMWRYLPYP
jgi:Galactose oxidase, central domain/Kelch motif